MFPDWNYILNSKDGPYPEIIDSYLIHSKYIQLCLQDIKNLYSIQCKINIDNEVDYFRYKEDVKIIYKYSLLFRNGVLKRSKILDIVFFNISNCFVTERLLQKKYKYLDFTHIPTSNIFHIFLMNLHFGRTHFVKKLENIVELTNYKSLFMNNNIKSKRNCIFSLNFISTYLNYCKLKNIDPSLIIILLGKSYFSKLELLSNNEYLIHYVAKLNYQIEFFLKIDKMNENFKFKLDNQSNKAYDYFLINKNNDVLRKLLNMEIDKKLERNYFSNISLLKQYFRLCKYYRENRTLKSHKEFDLLLEKDIDIDLLVDILKFDNDHFRENIKELMKKENIMLKFLEKCGTSINIWITRIIFYSYLSNNLCMSTFYDNKLINILYHFFKNNLIPDYIFNNSVNNIFAYIISNSSRYQSKEVDNIDTIVEIIKIIFNDKRFDKDKYPKLYFERFLETNHTRRTFVTKEHLNKLIKKLYNVERCFTSFKKERLINILLTGPGKKTNLLTKRKREV